MAVVDHVLHFRTVDGDGAEFVDTRVFRRHFSAAREIPGARKNSREAVLHAQKPIELGRKSRCVRTSSVLLR
jgi:hypothetical protein